MNRAVPEGLRCGWTARKGERGVYDCRQCGSWTANLPLYRDMICGKKERRKGKPDRRTR